MNYIETISAYINSELNAVFDNPCITDANIINIAQPLPRAKGEVVEVLPCYVDNSGEAAYVGPDDDYSLIAYHRINMIKTGKANAKAFGDDKQFDANQAQMSLVVFGRRDILQMTAPDMAIYLQAAWPYTVPAAIRQALSFYQVNISINEILLNDMQVFAEEFKNIDYFVKPEQFLFKINYTIESIFQRGCLQKFECLTD
jgi:hypothetical protein